MRSRLFAPVDIAPLVYARIVFGIVMVVEVLRYARYGWIRRYYIDPPFTFGYPGFEWVQPLPGPGMYALFVVLGIAGAMIAVGLFYRIATTVFAIGISYVFLLDQTNYLNHMYMICLVAGLLACVPAANAGSIDAWRKRESAQTVPAWCVWLPVGQIAIVYFFGGIAKLDGDWLTGVPGGMFLDDHAMTRSIADSEVGRKLFAFAGLAFDLLIVPALVWRRTRLFATAAAVAFHLSNFFLFDIGVFPWLMLALTPVFWPPAWSRWILERLRILRARDDKPAPEYPVRPWVMRALAAYLAIQIFLPLRHWLIPGEVNWTEEGHNFSWHMKLRIKHGTTRFVVRNPATGEEQQVSLRKLLSQRQIKKMATRPEMIRQFAHELARRYRDNGWSDVEVRAIARASLNGRPGQFIVDPTVDLAAKSWSPFAASWIVPLEDTPIDVDSSDSDDE
jgi:vitamin K-dependent gamma-carboxylase